MKKNVLSTVLILLITAFTISNTQASSSPLETMYKPAPIQIPAGTTLEAVKRAVRKGMYLKDWTISDAGPNRLGGEFKKGDKYSINLEIEYSPTSVNIHYKGSSGLNYDNGRIHRTYNERVLDLEKMIRAELDAF